jgi:polyferredoxin/uncharacterized protein with FMN-binding domain
MTKKIKKIQLFRHLVQLISFFLFPGFFMLAFGELKYIYQSLIKGELNFIQTMSMSVELILVILFTAILGRFFCGWICAFGTFNDLVYNISKKLFKTKFKINQKLDSKLKYLKYLVLVVIIVFSWTIGYSFFKYSSPWEAFAQITDINSVISSFAIGLFLLLLITVGAFFIERFFCRYLCPLGAIFTIISKLSIFNIDMPKYDCSNRSCRACTNNCSMGIPLNSKNEINGGECINCLSCIEICPSKNAKATIMNIHINHTLAVSIALATVIGFYSFYNIGSLTNASTISETSAKYNVNSNSNGSTSMQENGMSTTSTSTTPPATSTPLPNSSDSTSNSNKVSTDDNTSSTQNNVSNSNSVNSESNGTTSSVGSNSSIKENASSKSSSSTSNTPAQTTTSNSSTQNSNTKSKTASSSNTSKSTSSTSSTSKTSTISKSTSSNNNTSSNSSTTKTLKYKNGTYTGSGIGFRGGTTSVSVTINNDKITNLTTNYSEDTPRFYERVEPTLFDEIISSQSTSVDTVSGATYSSYGIMDAVADALNKALVNSRN